MALSVQCPGCDKNLKAKDELAGKRIKCPGCGQVLVAPAAKPASQLAPRNHPRQPQPAERPRQDLNLTVDLGRKPWVAMKPCNARTTTESVGDGRYEP